MNYQVVHEDEHKFTVEHPNGSHFQVAKGGLGEKLLKKIQGMKPKKMAEGGFVEENASELPFAEKDSPEALAQAALESPKLREYEAFLQFEKNKALTPNFMAPNSADDRARSDLQKYQELGSQPPEQLNQIQSGDLNSLGQIAQQGGPQSFGPTSGGPGPVSEEAPGINRSPAFKVEYGPVTGHPAFRPVGDPKLLNPVQVGPKPASAASPNAMGYLEQAMGLQASGIQGMTQAKMKEADAQAKLFDQFAAQQKLQADQYNARRMQLDKEMEQLSLNVQKGAIDPNRAWKNTSTGNKILATIGVVLGGIGSGLTRTPNDALKVVQNTIDRDIDAQKANLNQQNNLLSINLNKYRNLEAAEGATRLQMNAILQAQVAKVAAQAGSPEAKANGQILLGQLKMQAAPLMHQMAMMQLEGQSLGAGGGRGGLPVGQEPIALLGQKEYQEKRVVHQGRAYQAASPEDAKELKNMLSEYEPVRSAVNELTAMIGKPEALVPGTALNQKLQTLRSGLVPRLNKLHGLNRLSEEDIHLMKEQFADPSKLRDFLSGKAKNDQFLKNLNEDLDSNLQTRLIGYRGVGSYNTKPYQP